MNQVRNIIFDLGGVLLNINYDATATAFHQLGVEDFNQWFSQYHANELFSGLETGIQEEKVFVQQIQSLLPKPASETAILDAWNAMLLDFRSSSIAFLPQLAKTHRLFLLSNTNEIHLRAFQTKYEAVFEGRILDDLFEAAYYSHRIGFRKPTPESYQFVLNTHRLQPQETLFIDDSLPNIEAAKKLRINTIHLTNGALIEELNYK
ncbi:MAG: HAD family hydrolase [Bacteroidota bacterium]|jgi:FMN phosphatase YigB (HAD superfamily)